MAINSWSNVTLDSNVAAVEPDTVELNNGVAAGTAAASHLCVSWDSAVITTLSRWDAAVRSARQIAASSLPL